MKRVKFSKKDDEYVVVKFTREEAKVFRDLYGKGSAQSLSHATKGEVSYEELDQLFNVWLALDDFLYDFLDQRV